MTVMAQEIQQTARLTERRLVLAGLIIGVVLGQAGNFLAAPVPQALLYGLSSLGLVVALAFLAVQFVREGGMVVGIGFALLAAAEMLIFVGGIEGPGAHASFGAATLYYVPALILISAPNGLNLFARVAGGLAAVAFAGHSGLYLLGNLPAPDGPFAVAGYLLLTLAVIGWIIDVFGWRRQREA